jgi:hypothetical protein
MKRNRFHRASAAWPRLRGMWAVVALVVALVVAGGAQATRAAAKGDCKLVIPAAHWSIKIGAHSFSGNRYSVRVEGMSCSLAQTWVQKLTTQHSKAFGVVLKGPANLVCTSWAQPETGDNLVYSGVCKHAPGVPFFGWGPKFPTR